ncbi:MAG: KxYKxGKxW signal peptide domain-containing protein, partial [Streptococcus salivarius]
MENKVRFKLHKVKKNWVTIGVTTLSMVALAGGSLLAQGKVEADETSAPNGDGLQQLSEDGTASLVMTTTVTEQASAQASVSAIETVGTNSQVVTSVVSQETTAQVQTSPVASREVAVSSQTQASAQETLTTDQASQGQTSTQVAGQTSTQSTPRVLTNAAPAIATRAADSTIRINANRNTNITITASGTTPNVT